MSWSGSITNVGVTELALWGSGTTLRITGASVSTGSVSTSALPSQTALSGTTHPASIISQAAGSKTLTFKVQVKPDTSGYALRQVGIFGYVSGSAKLLGIWQESDGINIPASSASADYALTIDLVITVNNTGSLNVTIDTSTYVSNSALQSAVTSLSAVATTSSNGLMSAADKTKLDGWSGTTATTSTAGLMSAADKIKLDGVAAGANAYTHPSYTARTSPAPTGNQAPAFGGSFTIQQVTNDASGHVSAINNRSVTIPSTAATTSTPGLMSAADKVSVNNALKKMTVQSYSSLNSYNTPGIYYVSKNITANGWPSDVGSGSASYSVLLVLRADGSSVFGATQVLFANINGDEPTMWIRTVYNADFSNNRSWYQVYPPVIHTPT